MSGRSTFRQSLEKGSLGESYTDNCDWRVSGMDVPGFDGGAATAGDPTAIAAALLRGRTVFRQPADVWLLRHTLATLAARDHGTGGNYQTWDAAGSAAAG